MKASIAHKIRPSVLILGKDSRNQRWTPTDILLAVSYQRFLDEMCKQCGLPKYICHGTDNRIQFKGKLDECQSTGAAERKQSQIEEAKTKLYGTVAMGEPYLTDAAIEEGLEFSDFRTPYYIERAKMMGLIPESQP